MRQIRLQHKPGVYPTSSRSSPKYCQFIASLAKRTCLPFKSEYSSTSSIRYRLRPRLRLREHLNNPALKRSEVRAVLRTLSLPMTRVMLNHVKVAYQTYQANEDVKQLLEALQDDSSGPEPTAEQQPVSTLTLTVDDLHLVCWAYVWS